MTVCVLFTLQTKYWYLVCGVEVVLVTGVEVAKDVDPKYFRELHFVST